MAKFLNDEGVTKLYEQIYRNLVKPLEGTLEVITGKIEGRVELQYFETAIQSVEEKIKNNKTAIESNSTKIAEAINSLSGYLKKADLAQEVVSPGLQETNDNAPSVTAVYQFVADRISTVLNSTIQKNYDVVQNTTGTETDKVSSVNAVRERFANVQTVIESLQTEIGKKIDKTQADQAYVPKYELTNLFKYKGSSTSVPSLPEYDDSGICDEEGSVYNISMAFTTTSDFLEGAGHKYPSGTNIVLFGEWSGRDESNPMPRRILKWDILSGLFDVETMTDDDIANAIAAANTHSINI